MRFEAKNIHRLITASFLLCVLSLPAIAEESKGILSWNSNFIKKSTKPKGTPVNPPKKKVKGIPTQNISQSANAELTEQEKKAIEVMSKNAGTPMTAGKIKKEKRPPYVLAPGVPRIHLVPKPVIAPKNPNQHAIRIPSPPTAFSSNAAANSEITNTSDPNKR